MEAADILAQLVNERGALVSSANCTESEIVAARAFGRFFVTADGLGFVLRPRVWREGAQRPADPPRPVPPPYPRDLELPPRATLPGRGSA
jgi:hypothetical protein